MRYRRRQRGQAIVEMAIIVPFLITFAMTALDLGRLFYYDSQFENALREAARYAAKTTNVSTTDVQAIIQQEGNLPSGSVSAVTVTNVSGSLGSESIEQVSATYSYTFISPWLNAKEGLLNPIAIRTYSAAEVDN